MDQKARLEQRRRQLLNELNNVGFKWLEGRDFGGTGGFYVSSGCSSNVQEIRNQLFRQISIIDDCLAQLEHNENAGHDKRKAI